MKRDWFKFYEADVPREIELPIQGTLFDMLETACATQPQTTAVSFFGNTISYAELLRMVDQFATALSRLHVSQGDRVALILPNVPQYPIAHFAILKIGAIPVPINPLYVEREIEYQLNDSGARTVVVLDLYYPRVAAVWQDASLDNVIVARASDYLPRTLKLLYPIKARKDGQVVRIDRRPGLHFFPELMNEPFAVQATVSDVRQQDIALLLYTGGTTGIAKGAVLTHRNLLANIIQLHSWLGRTAKSHEVNLCALPFFHSYGLTTGLHISVYMQATMVLIPNPRDIPAILRTIQRTKATLFSGVPTLFVAINSFPRISGYDLSSIKACISGSAPLPLEVARKFEALTGGKLVEGYGLSECSPVTHANPISGRRQEGSIGLPLPGTDAKIVHPDTREELPVGQVGELAVRGPQVMREYWNMPIETDAVLVDGWLYTGDMARRDRDGYFYIVDRKKDMIVAGGYNVYPRDVEEVLFEHPKILEAAVVGVPDEYRGETVKAYIVCKAGQVLTADEVVDFCRERLAKYKIPRYIEFRESLPKSNIGKVLKRLLVDEVKQASDPKSD